MTKISLILPVYNGARTIEKVVKDFYTKVITKLPDSELIVAEDGSTDGTKEIIKRLGNELPIKIIAGEQRKGYLKAFRDALKLSNSEIIFLSDSDGEHDPEDFWRLYKEIPNFDIVLGYKTHRKPFYRVFISKIHNYLIGLFFGVWLKDSNCGFRLIRKQVIDAVADDIGILRIAPNAELIIRAKYAKFRIKQIPVKHFDIPSVVFSYSNFPKMLIKEFYDLYKLKQDLNKKF